MAVMVGMVGCRKWTFVLALLLWLFAIVTNALTAEIISCPGAVYVEIAAVGVCL
jgi:hypothetical protein